MRQARAELDKCAAMIKAAPSWQVLKSKLPPEDARPAPKALLDDSSLPGADEVRALLELHQDGTMPCRTYTLEYSARTHPAFVRSLARTYALADDTYLQLVRREISWGDYARANAKWRVESEQKLTAVRADIQRNAATPFAYEAKQRQEAAGDLQTWLEGQQQLNRQQKMISPSSLPRITNCQYVGMFLNCSTFVDPRPI